MPFPREVTKRLGATKKWTCEICHKKWSDGWLMEGHHILPTSLGGTNDPSNFQLLCVKCHLEEHKAIALTQTQSVYAVEARLRRTRGRWK